MKYKVGDRVRIKSIDWYNENKDNYGSIYAGNGFCFWKNMARLCGEIMKITSVKVDPEDSNKGYYFMENSEEKWTDEMIECKVEEETKPKFKVGDKVILDSYPCVVTDVNWRDSLHCFVYTVRGADFGKMVGEEDLVLDERTVPNTNEIIQLIKNDWNNFKDRYDIPDDYHFVDKNGNEINISEIVLEKKKKEYPKTFEECVHVLEGEIRTSLEQMNTFRKLIDARNAYWKIAGEEMELGRPWDVKYGCGEWGYWIAYDVNANKIYCQDSRILVNHLLVFPTAEIRDAFYEHFKDLIEECKELL